MPLSAAVPTSPVEAGVSPWLWLVSIAVLVVLLIADFVVTRRPHEVSIREAAGWSVFYLALPVVFGLWLWNHAGGDRALEFMTGFVVEKSLSVDNLFVFMLLLAAFAVPAEVQQRRSEERRVGKECRSRWSP